MKVYLDEDVSPIVARLLHDKGVDAVSAHEVGRVQLDDRARLAEATGAGRAIVTANVVDFLALARRDCECPSPGREPIPEGSGRARRLSPAKPVARGWFRSFQDRPFPHILNTPQVTDDDGESAA